MVAAAATVEEGLEIVDATVLYLNTLSSWLDASIPWSGIDVLPAVDVRGSGREAFRRFPASPSRAAADLARAAGAARRCAVPQAVDEARRLHRTRRGVATKCPNSSS